MSTIRRATAPVQNALRQTMMESEVSTYLSLDFEHADGVEVMDLISFFSDACHHGTFPIIRLKIYFVLVAIGAPFYCFWL